MADKKRKMSKKQFIAAMTGIAKLTYDAAPLAVFIKITGALVTVVLPLVTTYYAALTTTALADAYAGDPQAGGRAISYVIITAALGVLLTAWGSLEQYIDQLTRYQIEAAMSDRMYERFLSLDFWRYDDKDTIDSYDRAKKFADYFAYVFDQLIGLLTQIFTMVAGFVALVFVSWWLGLILLLAVVPSLLIQLSLSRKQAAHWDRNIETRRTQGMIEYNMFTPKKIAELRLYGMVRYLLDLRLKLREKDERERIQFERKYIFKRLGGDILEAAGEVIALLYTTLQIIAQTQPIGQFLYVQQVVSRALGGARGFISQISNIDEEMVNMFDYQEFMKLPVRPGGTQQLRGQPENIALESISFHYPHTKTYVLSDISLLITSGQHVAIVGENGAGKSTLIKILTGLYQPTSGKMTLDGVDIQDIDIKTWHSMLGVLQQEYLSYGFASAKDNIYFGDVSAPFDSKRFEAALDRAEARTFLEKLPKGADNFVLTWMEHNDGTKGVDLSGGQWQRLALARNFYRDSPIIILDEPTSAIDALAESRIFKQLFADKKRTVIAISHRLTTVEKADVIFMLKDGRIVEQGTHEQLVALRGAYYTMFESQLR
jgi:ATP-binding cassette subfamily B protein/ATP-binding cassette subfamily C protein